MGTRKHPRPIRPYSHCIHTTRTINPTPAPYCCHLNIPFRPLQRWLYVDNPQFKHERALLGIKPCKGARKNASRAMHTAAPSLLTTWRPSQRCTTAGPMRCHADMLRDVYSMHGLLPALPQCAQDYAADHGIFVRKTEALSPVDGLEANERMMLASWIETDVMWAARHPADPLSVPPTPESLMIMPELPSTLDSYFAQPAVSAAALLAAELKPEAKTDSPSPRSILRSGEQWEAVPTHTPVDSPCISPKSCMSTHDMGTAYDTTMLVC
jgi:hypothetical protein